MTAAGFVGSGTALSVRLRARGAARIGAKLTAVLITEASRADRRW